MTSWTRLSFPYQSATDKSAFPVTFVACSPHQGDQLDQALFSLPIKDHQLSMDWSEDWWIRLIGKWIGGMVSGLVGWSVDWSVEWWIVWWTGGFVNALMDWSVQWSVEW